MKKDEEVGFYFVTPERIKFMLEEGYIFDVGVDTVEIKNTLSYVYDLRLQVVCKNTLKRWLFNWRAKRLKKLYEKLYITLKTIECGDVINKI